jgi:integrase
MADSTGSPRVRKPRPDFPLFPHATGRWAKKIGGQLVYFGPLDDPMAAVRLYELYQQSPTEFVNEKKRQAARSRLAKPSDTFPLFHHATGRWAKKVQQKLLYFGKVADDPKGEKALALWLAHKRELLHDEPTELAMAGPASSVRKTPGKVRKPHKDFPLFPHATGRWAKKVRGKFVFFGKCSDDPDGEAALNAWLDQKDDLLAGRTPRAKTEGFAVRDLANRFLTAKQQMLDAGEMTQRTWNEYKLTTDRVVEQFGKHRLVADLATEDFEALRASFAKTRGPEALGNEIQRTRALFKYAYDAGLIEQPMRFGPLFKRPSKKVMRIARAKAGPKMFEQKELFRLLHRAGPQMKAMILLALNCGFGNNDCATLPLAAVNLEKGWIEFPRPKTGIARRCPLWRETVKRLRAVLDRRKAPEDKAHARLLFITKRGGCWAKESGDNPVTKEFAKLMKAEKLRRDGRGFYSLRHTFRTIADGCRDFPAINLVMGHADHSVADRYRERIDDARLAAVVNHVRAWFFAKEKAGELKAKK